MKQHINEFITGIFEKICFAFCLILVSGVTPNLTASAEPEVIPDGYHVETIEPPEDVVFEVGGIGFAPDGTTYFCTRYGDVWSYKDGSWNQFARNLQEPIGILVDQRAEQRTVYVAQKPELTALVDTDADGTAERYRTISDEWGLSRDYHEYAYGPVRDSRGNFYVMLNLSAGTGPGVRDSTMTHGAPYRGCLMRIAPDGTTKPYAYGFRSALGLEVTPSDRIVVTDGQGDWLPTSNFHVVKKGSFHGHPVSLMDVPEFRDRDLDEVPVETFEELRRRPALWFPYEKMGTHPGEPAFYSDEQEFGPFQGQFFVPDQEMANVMRVSLQKVNGKYQGAVMNFVDHLQSGSIRAEFGPEGRDLWIGQTDRGWGAIGKKRFGVQRIVYDGKTRPFSLKTIRARSYGFELLYTKPIDAEKAKNPDNYTIEHWHYDYHADYGSDRKNVTGVKPQAVNVTSSGKRVQLKLKNMPTPRVYMIRADVPGPDGSSPVPETGYYTLNRAP